MGSNEKGQLGLGSERTYFDSPYLMMTDPEIVSITCGYEFSFILTSKKFFFFYYYLIFFIFKFNFFYFFLENRILCFGKNTEGQVQKNYIFFFQIFLHFFILAWHK